MTASYKETMFWYGGPGGLTKVAVKKRDQNGTPIYAICPGPTWLGAQEIYAPDGKNIYEDLWIMPEAEPKDVEVAHGIIKVVWQTFDSTWQAYMKSMPDGLYAERTKVWEGLSLPLIEDLGCYPIELESIWS